MILSTYRLRATTAIRTIHVRWMPDGSHVEDVCAQAETLAAAQHEPVDIDSAVQNGDGKVVAWERIGVRVRA